MEHLRSYQKVGRYDTIHVTNPNPNPTPKLEVRYDPRVERHYFVDHSNQTTHWELPSELKEEVEKGAISEAASMIAELQTPIANTISEAASMNAELQTLQEEVLATSTGEFLGGLGCLT